MLIRYYNGGFKIMPALIGICQDFNRFGMETLYLDCHSETLISGECGWHYKVHVSHAEDKCCVLIIEDERINV